MIVGYARVSTGQQTVAQQVDQLAAAGAEKICQDVMSGARDDRPGLLEMISFLRSGDTVIVWRLDRLGRNLRSILETSSARSNGQAISPP